MRTQHTRLHLSLDLIIMVKIKVKEQNIETSENVSNNKKLNYLFIVIRKGEEYLVVKAEFVENINELNKLKS